MKEIGEVKLVIQPGVGVGTVRLGMWPCRVRAKLGPPLGWENWGDGNLNDSLIYAGLRMRFRRFGSSGPSPIARLSAITVRRPDALLYGRALSDWNMDELVAELRARNFHRREFRPGYYVFDNPYLAVWFEWGHVNEVEI